MPLQRPYFPTNNGTERVIFGSAQGEHPRYQHWYSGCRSGLHVLPKKNENRCELYIQIVYHPLHLQIFGHGCQWVTALTLWDIGNFSGTSTINMITGFEKIFRKRQSFSLWRRAQLEYIISGEIPLLIETQREHKSTKTANSSLTPQFWSGKTFVPIFFLNIFKNHQKH